MHRSADERPMIKVRLGVALAKKCDPLSVCGGSWGQCAAARACRDVTVGGRPAKIVVPTGYLSRAGF
jgi:hypothetical protein